MHSQSAASLGTGVITCRCGFAGRGLAGTPLAGASSRRGAEGVDAVADDGVGPASGAGTVPGDGSGGGVAASANNHHAPTASTASPTAASACVRLPMATCILVGRLRHGTRADPVRGFVAGAKHGTAAQSRTSPERGGTSPKANAHAGRRGLP
jgi:hypothetical protein